MSSARQSRARRLLAAVALLLAAFVGICWAGIALLGALPGDAASAAEVREEPLSWIVLAPAHALDWVGQPVPAAVLTLVLAVWIWRAIGGRHALLIVAALGVTAITWALKAVVERPRPMGSALHGPSFPSGHTALAIAVLGMLAVFALQRRWWVVAAASLAIVAAMGPSRVLLGVHWASDVLAGYAVGAAYLIALLLAGMRWAEAGDRRSSASTHARARSHG